MPKTKFQIKKEKLKLAEAIKNGETKEDIKEQARRLFDKVIHQAQKRKEKNRRKNPGIIEGAGVTQYGDVINFIAAVDDGDKRIVSDKEEAAKKKQQKEHFKKQGKKQEEKEWRKTQKDPRGPYVQFVHQKEGDERAWNRIVDKYIMLLVRFADIERKGDSSRT